MGHAGLVGRLCARAGVVVSLRLCVVTLALLVPAGVACAQSAPSSATRPRTPWGPDALPATALAVTIMSVGLGLYFGHEGPGTGDWRGGILLDDAARDGLRLRSPGEREAAATASDVTLTATLLLGGLLDALVVPLLEEDLHLAWQATAAYTLALGVTLIVQELVKATAGRARPLVPECPADGDGRGCGDDAFKSFFSGHAATSFASAGFSCAMHLSRSLYGEPAADGASCAVSLLMAGTTGLLRIAADMHYLSDVVVGAAFGFLVGYLVPLALVPERPPSSRAEGEPASGPSVAVLPTASPAPGGGLGTLGLAAMGLF